VGGERLPSGAVSYIDIGIIVILAVALLTGWWRGLLRPLITWAFIVAGVVVGFGDPSLASRFAPSPGWRPFMGLVVVVVFALAGILAARLLRRLFYGRIGAISALDRLGGALVSGILALVAIFILLSLLVTLEQAGAPVEGSGTVSAQQVAEVQSNSTAHPSTAILLDPTQLQQAQQKLGSSSTPAADIGQLSGPLGVLRAAHTQMVESRIAPVIFGLGQRIPFLCDGQSWPSS
jgi:hypothetical protein